MSAVNLSSINLRPCEFPLSTNLDSELTEIQKVWFSIVKAQDHLKLFYKLALSSVEVCLNGKYSELDAHTTANCCHGVSVRIVNLLNSVLKQDLLFAREFLGECISKIENYSQKPIEKLIAEVRFKELKCELFELAAFRALKIASFLDETRGRITCSLLLKSFGEISSKFLKKMTNRLQKTIADQVAQSYYLYPYPEKIILNSIPIQIWRKYVSQSFLRRDSQSVSYASNLYSTQVVLAYLMYTNSRFAFLIDLLTSKGKLIKRCPKILEGNSFGYFSLLTEKEISLLDFHDPIIVFGGYSVVNDKNYESIEEELRMAASNFEMTCLACDVHYPEFPAKKKELDFDSNAIQPEEEELKTLFSKFLKIKGYSVENPFPCMLSHYFPASLKEVFSAEDTKSSDNSALPYANKFTPNRLKKNHIN